MIMIIIIMADHTSFDLFDLLMSIPSEILILL